MDNVNLGYQGYQDATPSPQSSLVWFGVVQAVTVDSSRQNAAELRYGLIWGPLGRLEEFAVWESIDRRGVVWRQATILLSSNMSSAPSSPPTQSKAVEVTAAPAGRGSHEPPCESQGQ